jgi:predicted transcriptional regulator of viral defense system
MTTNQPIWSTIRSPEFDYQVLMHTLRDYAKPRDRVTTLMKQGVVQRIKKGLYVFGEGYGRNPFSHEILSNLIYGPSYISLEYALQFHGLIPERVKALTAVCLGSSKRFETPVGLFTYHSIPAKAFHLGVERIKVDNDRAYLMADAEKALVDKVKSGHGISIKNQEEMRQYLIEDLRADWDTLLDMDLEKIETYASAYSSFKLTILLNLLRQDKRKIG